MTDSSNKLERLIAEYLEALEAGKQPDRDSLISANSDVANDLNSFFANHDAIQAANDDATRSLKEPPSEQPTIAPNPHDDATIPPTDSSADTEPTQATGPGTTIKYFGDYELIEEIARGGMGVVYKAKQTKLNRVVALKMILAGQLASDDDVKRFYTEAEAAANLDHPGIVPIHEIGEHEGQHYFSMSFVEGESLADRIKDGPLPPREAAEITKKVAEAIAYAHERGVIHRDLKPGNILMDANGEPRVTDFGLAKKVEGDSDLTATGQILGTPSYMPPEQAAGKIDEIDERADVYSLGAILYALLTGRPPFQAASAIDTLMQVMEQEPVSPRVLNGGVPIDLETVCLKLLEKDTRRRYESAIELVDELRRYLNGEPIVARPLGRPSRTVRWCKRNPTQAMLIGMAAASLLLGTTVSIAFGIDASRQASLAAEKFAEAQFSRRVSAEALYGAEMQLFQVEFEEGNFRVAKQHLGRAEESSELYGGEHSDLRGWEWHYGHKLCRSFLTKLEHDETTNLCVAYGPSGKYLATGGSGGITLWELSESLMVWSSRIGRVNDLRFSTEGDQIICGGDRVLILDSQTGETTRECYAAEGKCTVVEIAHHPSGLYVAAACSDPQAILIWDAMNGQLIREIDGRFQSVDFSADGRHVAFGRTDTVRVHNVGDFELASSVGDIDWQRGERIRCLKFSPGGQTLAIGTTKRVRFLTVNNWESTLSIPRSTAAISFGRHSDHVVFTAGFDLEEWNIASGEPVWSVPVTSNDSFGGVLDVCYSPMGHRIATVDHEGSAKVWDRIAYRDQEILDTGTKHKISDLTFSADGKKCMAAAKDAAVVVWDINSGQSETSLVVSGGKKSIGPHQLALSRDGKHLFSCCQGGMRCWEVASDTLLWETIDDHAILDIGLSPDETLVVSAGLKGRVKAWNARDGTWVRDFVGHRSMVGSIDVHPNGDMMATSTGRNLVIWDLRSGEVLHRESLINHSGPTQFMSLVKYSPDGKFLAVTLDRVVSLRVAETGERIWNFEDHQTSIRGIAFSPDGDRIVTATTKVKVWSTTSGRELYRLNIDSDAVAFTPDGSRLALGYGQSVTLLDSRRIDGQLRIRREARGLLDFLGTDPSRTAETTKALQNVPDISKAVREYAEMLL